MSNKLFKDIVIFVMITIVAGFSLAAVNSVTKGPIAKQNELIIQNSYRTVFDEGHKFINNKKLDQLVKNSSEILKKSNLDFGENGIVINDILVAYSKNEKIIGHVIKVTTKDGYGGNIDLVVGIDLNNSITGIEIITIDETVGLGMNAKNESFKNQYYHKNANYFTITKTGKQADNEIDALSGATITSKAFNNAVNGAITINKEIMEVMK